MSASENNNGRATNKQLLEAIQELTINVKVMTHKLDAEITKNEKLISDHEARIRNLEKLVWTSSWISSSISTVLTAVAVMFFTGKL